jgi:hypothetical protein
MKRLFLILLLIEKLYANRMNQMDTHSSQSNQRDKNSGIGIINSRIPSDTVKGSCK